MYYLTPTFLALLSTVLFLLAIGVLDSEKEVKVNGEDLRCRYKCEVTKGNDSNCQDTYYQFISYEKTAK